MPRHIEDFRGRAKEILGCAVAVQTPLHTERLGLVDYAHLVHRSVATVATDPAVHVDRVIEVGVVRQTVDLHPRDGLAGLPAFTHRRKTRAVRQDLSFPVTVDAGLGGWEVGVGGHLDEAVAVAAVHSELFDMQRMGEGNRLIRLVADPGVLGGEIVPDTESDGGADHQNTNQQLERQPIGPSGKEIRHRVV